MNVSSYEFDQVGESISGGWEVSFPSKNAGDQSRDKLLCVDDDPLSLRSLVTLLQTLGYKVDSADSAEEAIQLIDSTKYGVVITDMIMPSMNGLELTARIRSIQPNLPVIVISGSTLVDLQSLPQEERPDCILVKPLEFDKFSRQLKRLLGVDA